MEDPRNMLAPMSLKFEREAAPKLSEGVKRRWRGVVRWLSVLLWCICQGRLDVTLEEDEVLRCEEFSRNVE